VLDPTCGSGAFLFAALKILEPLLDKCLDRMEDFVEDEELLRPNSTKFSVFRRVLDEIEKHPNRRYFVLKSIIVNNLFGVDIMPDATEICKLRLFLQLVAQVDADTNKKNYGLEPLPDIDFNIRAGNTLVGFANEKEVYQAFQGVTQARLAFDDRADEFKEKAEQTAQIYEHFRLQQIKEGGEITAEDKANLQTKLRELSDELDKFIAHEYGIDEIKNPQKFANFLKSHQPFHWYSEFYGIIAGGGFDVIIGNPPYVEYSKIKPIYEISNYNSENSGNLYAFICERSLQISRHNGRLGLIVPIAIVSVAEVQSIREILKQGNSNLWTSSFAIRPAKLFEGVEQRLTIIIGLHQRDDTSINFSTKYHQWYVGERPNLFKKISYCNPPISQKSYIPKVNSLLELKILEKIENARTRIAGEFLVKQSAEKLYFHRTPGYWIRMMNFEPFFKSPTHDRSIHHIRELDLSNSEMADFIGAIGSSSMFFFYFFSVGNCRNLTLDDVKSFPIGKPSKEISTKITKLFKELMVDFNKNSTVKSRGVTQFQEFDWGASKPIIDEIDRVLAKHYGFTDEELDFIINYDIKYRMGRDSSESE
jgi:hypothetical protein